MPRRRVWWGGRRGKAGLGTGAADRGAGGAFRSQSHDPQAGAWRVLGKRRSSGSGERGAGTPQRREQESQPGWGCPRPGPCRVGTKPAIRRQPGGKCVCRGLAAILLARGTGSGPIVEEDGEVQPRAAALPRRRSDPTLVVEELHRPLTHGPPSNRRLRAGSLGCGR